MSPPPWTDEQVAALNARQHGRADHPLTCRSGNRRDVKHRRAMVMYGDHDFGILRATRDGWVCLACGYRQGGEA